MNHLEGKNFAIVDVETTGGSATWHRVIEIGVIRVENGRVVREYNTLVNPETSIPSFITHITGITSSAVEDAPVFFDIYEDLLDLFHDAVFVAHNAGFDYNFIRSEFLRIGVPFVMPKLCTVRLSRALFREYARHDLSSIIERFSLSCENRHRAYDDAKVVWDFLTYLGSCGRGEEVAREIQKLLKTKVLRGISELHYEPCHE